MEQAKQFAEDWYLAHRGKVKAGLVKKREKSFREAAAKFEEEYTTITEGQRSAKWVQGHSIRIRLHLNPFFGDLGLSEVTPGKVQDYRVHRVTPPPVEASAGDDAQGPEAEPPVYKPPARSTLHDEIVTLRLVLKTAIRHGWLAHLPDLSPPYKTRGKIAHRPWFSPTEYKQLYEAARDYAKQSHGKPWQWDAEQVYDYILFMANTGMRPDEAKNLQHRDVTIVDDAATRERILAIEVRGKVGFGNCKSMPGAVRVYERLLSRPKPERRGKAKEEGGGRELPRPTDPVFPGLHIKLFNGILKRAELKLDREGHKRTAYSLRHTYICMRLTEGADIYQIAKNCRTSVEMIQRFYAAHIMNSLDAAAINVMRPTPRPRRKPADLAAGEDRSPKAAQPIILPESPESSAEL
ncbi:tyrosine-type recombinase/integrase [Bradyrhizobium lupini]|uniref:tyrosine-type recombinase/integrase n=1 Tax=Rhizobium lupini TaxID=136996 RepID=UPI00366B1DBA